MKEKAGPAAIAVAVALVLVFAFVMYRRSSAQSETLNSTNHGTDWSKMGQDKGYNPGGKK